MAHPVFLLGSVGPEKPEGGGSLRDQGSSLHSLEGKHPSPGKQQIHRGAIMRQGGSVGGGKGREGRCRGPQGYRLSTRQGPGGQAKEMGCHPGGSGRAREGLHQGAAAPDLGFAKMLHPVAV